MEYWRRRPRHIREKFELGMLVDDPSLSKWTVHMQRRPRDVNLHTGMLYGLWFDVDSLVSSRDADIFDAQGAGIPANEFLRRLQHMRTTMTYTLPQ
jgi:hypothetical protein